MRAEPGSAPRRRFSHANVISMLALVLALSGGAFAATKELITSSAQIKPSVRTQLLPKAYAVFNNGPVTLAQSSQAAPTQSVATMSKLPKGTYVIDAKVELGTEGAMTICKLTAQNDFDQAVTSGATVATLPLEVTHTFTSGGGSVVLACGTAGQAVALWAKVDAIQVASRRLQSVSS